MCFLTGQRAFDSLLERARELKAIDQIIQEMQQEGAPDNDAQLQQAREQLLPRFLTQFHSAIRETFTTLYYPTRDRLATVDFLMEFKGNHYNGEEQVRTALGGKQKYTTDISSDTFRQKVEQRLFTQQTMQWTEIKRRAATSPVWQWHRPDALERLKADCIHKDVWREEGSYVNKGPFPKPATEVRIRELSRDDETGLVKLRLTPVNGDTIFVDVGGEATTASTRLMARDYETRELRVSFLAVDSSGKHKTGDAVEWQGRITLKSRDYMDGERRMVELRSAPRAPILYSTDGSDPQVSGGVYDEPFALPEGTRWVLAVAKKDGQVSEQHRREITERPVDKPVVLDQPNVWTPDNGFQFTATRPAYGFINRLKGHRARASGVRVAVQEERGEWGELNLSDGVELDGDSLERVVEGLREFVSVGEVSVEAKRIHYDSGQRFVDYIADVKAVYRRKDVKP